MKKNYWKLSSIAFTLTAMLFVASCSDDDPKPEPEPEPDDTELIGELTGELTLKNGKTYNLTGGYTVKAGATLTIEPGVIIIAKNDDKVDYILVEQGGKIMADGTASSPIIMTSEKKEAGAWGGIHICGKAKINVAGGTAKSEIGDATYGGNDDADNSGVLKYIRLEYTGYAFDEEHEANGVTFYGVGNGTKVEYLQAYKGSDDGFEWFGGSVNVKYLVATSCSDDSFDWTQGWTGKAQFLVAYQENQSTLGYDCDCLIEADNDSKVFGATPVSAPVLANLTLVGNNSDTNKRGIRLRAGTHAKIYNALVKGKANTLTTETTETETALSNGTSILNNILLETTFSGKEGIYTAAMFTKDGVNKENQIIALTDAYVGVEDGGTDVTKIDPFFTSATYTGAVQSSNDWTAGWTIKPGATETSVELKGELTKDLTLKNGLTYYLTGGYHVKSGATLTIEPGVRLIAKDDDIVDYILIEQGAKINAEGTASNPIVMTSEKAEAGAWGGLHICGKAKINVTGGTAKSEIGDATYGGDDNADNSGKLRYIRLEYTGYAFDEEHEANGVTFYGVGNGTTVEYLQAYKGSDDGFEWFGGSVNVKYLVATSCSDDSFDWTQGWSGKGQFLVAYQESQSTLGYDCDCLIEADNDSKVFGASPVSSPVLANLTLVGNNSDVNKRGIRLRAGTHAKIYNALVKGKANTLTTETTETETALDNGTSVLNNIWLATTFSGKEGIYTSDKFNAGQGNAQNKTFSLTSNYVGTEAGGSDLSADTFFAKAEYKGAVPSDNDWTKGWAK